MRTDLATGLNDDLPSDVNEFFAGCYRGLTLLKKRGFAPAFVVDVGASTGCWSYHARMIYPSARYILVEPLASTYREGRAGPWLAESFPEFELVPMAVSDHPGLVSLNIASDLCSSSVYALDKSQFDHAVEVEAITLDNLAREKHLLGRGLLKMDIQFAEDAALKGATELIRQVDAAVLEMSMVRYYENCKVFLEMLQIMDELGFQYFDDVGEYRRPDGILSHKDGLFVRKGHFV